MERRRNSKNFAIPLINTTFIYESRIIYIIFDFLTLRKYFNHNFTNFTYWQNETRFHKIKGSLKKQLFRCPAGNLLKSIWSAD